MTCGQTGWTFHGSDLDSPDVMSLLANHFAQARAVSPPEGCHVLDLERLRDPAISFWAVRDEAGVLLGFGALKELEPGHGEVKSMRTAPEALGKGVGSAILAHILAEATRRDYRRISLETGSTPEYVPARRLYERHGFTRCPAFGDYKPTAFNIFYSLLLDGRA